MAIHPIVSALQRHKVGTLLIALQIAFTLAIVCNALFVIHNCFDKMHRTTGLHEDHLFMIETTSASGANSAGMSSEALDASIRGDLVALRRLPSVEDAYESNSLPLSNMPWSNILRTSPNDKPHTFAEFFNADDHTIGTLGLTLVGGRNFRADEIGGHDQLSGMQPSVVIVSRQLATMLFPNGNALGNRIYFMGTVTPSTIVGIVDRMQTASANGFNDSATWNSILVPFRMVNPTRYYVVRAKNGQLAAAMKAAEAALYAQDPLRIIPDGEDGDDIGIRSFAQIRAAAYATDRTLAMLMGVIGAILLSVTGAGIAGLSSFWVTQRRRQIGMRRALGATARDILNYFLVENALISGSGAMLGIVLAYAFNYWLMSKLELTVLSSPYVFIGVAITVLLSQAAAFAPALRASKIAPMEAIRTF
ncbi:MAG TPA: FtsX-like permease family protein [Dyella sp.]|nr:FtsX-like permease family protein [Dyella sp.]